MRKIKTRYCKYCGGLINTDKVCESCGHKFFKISKKHISIVSLLIFISALCYIFVYMACTIRNYKASIDYQNEVILSQNETIAEYKRNAISADIINQKCKDYKTMYDNLQKSYNAKKRENDLIRYDLIWYQNHVAITTRYGECYHTIDCYHLDNSDTVYVESVESAKQKGYRECSECETMMHRDCLDLN